MYLARWVEEMIRKYKPRKVNRRSSKHTIVMFVITIGIVGALMQFMGVHGSVALTQVNTSGNVGVANQVDIVRLPVPIAPVPRGTRVGDIGVKYTDWPSSNNVEQYINDETELKQSTARSFLVAGVPVARGSVSTDPLDANAVAEKIPVGMRAITVSVNEEAAIEGWAQSGSYVDVIALTRREEDSGMEARVIAENVKILSAGRSTVPHGGAETAPGAPDTVTLLCQQEDCLRIKMATKVGNITFSLRGMIDQEPTQAVALSQDGLLGSGVQISPENMEFKGYAKGPDGSMYVLKRGDARWSKKSKD